MIKKHGVIRLYRKGIDVDDAHFTLLYPLPLASSSETVKRNFDSNQFSVTRQLKYSATHPMEEIDMVLFVNGLPFATMELKKPIQVKMPSFMDKTNTSTSGIVHSLC